MSRPDWDPGWGAQVAAMFIPSRRAALGGAQILSTVRFVWLAFALSLFSWFVVVASIASWNSGEKGWLSWVIVGFGFTLHVVVIPSLLRRMASVSPDASDPQLLEAFRTANFAGLVASELVALVGVAAVVVARTSWLFVVALPFWLLGMFRVGPFQRTFARVDQLLQERGSVLRMTEAWRRASA